MARGRRIEADLHAAEALRHRDWVRFPFTNPAFLCAWAMQLGVILLLMPLSRRREW